MRCALSLVPRYLFPLKVVNLVGCDKRSASTKKGFFRETYFLVNLSLAWWVIIIFLDKTNHSNRW
jgi:hypothetical protein